MERKSHLKLEKIFVVYPGEKTFPLTENITACTLEFLIKEHLI